MSNYDPHKIEPKWQDKWYNSDVFKAEDFSDKEKAYVLDMFPYPSGEGLHVGHPEGYTATDIFSRYLRAKGKNVLHPMGWDAFGLPAENYAIKKKLHPRDVTKKNVNHFREQVKRIGFSYDWSREVNTTDPEYYKWTQWIFLQLFKKGLAYEDIIPINWCPSCKTGIANEEVVNGECERCHAEVEKKDMKQWILRITEYADRLLKDIDLLDWPEKIKEMQRNWIGRSEGHKIEFAIKNHELKLDVFTTRIDTLYGATFMVVAPEHPFLKEIVTDDQAESVAKYQKEAKMKTDIDRESLEKEKTGVFSGAYALNPVNDKAIPIWVADYVMMSYGSGAIMAVPAHDERDFEFAKKYDLDIVPVIEPQNYEDISYKKRMTVRGEEYSLNTPTGWGNEDPFLQYKKRVKKGEECHLGEGALINSGEFDGQTSEEGKQGIAKLVGAKTEVNYKLRDWVFSRQRYWGEPIPIVHCKNCGVVPVPEKDLPVTLPEVENYEPTGTGESPLAAIEEWVNTTCPECGSDAKRETNTMPQWAGSCWYYLRYIDPHNDEAIFDKKKMQYWCPVDTYVGGAEHAVLHLLYARFWHKVLYDLQVVDHPEPFLKLTNQGLILGEDGVKMSKSRGNVINPDDVINEFGADTFRMYEMFMGPFEDDKPWDTKGIMGIRRFLEKVWNMIEPRAAEIAKEEKPGKVEGEVAVQLHKTIKKVSEDIDKFHFNTAISAMMVFINFSQKNKVVDLDSADAKAVFEPFLKILAPFAPHITEELWSQLGYSESISKASWPEYDEDLVKEDTVELVIQVNGKVRDKMEVAPDIDESEALRLAQESDKIKKWTEGKNIVKEIYVPGRLVNIVAK